MQRNGRHIRRAAATKTARRLAGKAAATTTARSVVGRARATTRTAGSFAGKTAATTTPRSIARKARAATTTARRLNTEATCPAWQATLVQFHSIHIQRANWCI